MRYAIAEYLPETAIDAALSRNYAAANGSKRPYPRDAEGYCPLGRALATVDPDATHDPDSGEVADVLLRDDDTSLWTVVQLCAHEFITDWDGGYIPDLAAALGREVTA